MRSIRTTAVSTGEQLLAFGALLGRSGRTIESEISGTSMGSTLPSGCRIRIRPLASEEYRSGQVVAFVAGSALFAHRIVYCGRQGVLTRGDSHTLCDLPVPMSAIVGVVSDYFVNGKWHLLDNSAPLDGEMKKRNRVIEGLLRVCLQIDIRVARRVSRILLWLAGWRRHLIAGQPSEFVK